MENLGISIQLSEAWADGSATVTPVEIKELSGSAPEHRAVFSLSPQDEKDRRRIMRRLGVCEKCDGDGYITAMHGRELRAVLCPVCKNKRTRPDDPAVRLEVLKDCCHGWEGWCFLKGPALGKAIPFSEKILAKITEDDAVFGLIVGHATTLKKDYEQAEEGNSQTGQPTSPGTLPSQTTSSPAFDES